MNIVILTLGTRGDVQPFLALAIALQAAGYQVTLGADTEFKTMIEERKVPYVALHLGLKEYLNSEEGKQAMHKEQAGKDSFEQMVRPMLDACWEAAQDADLLIYDTMLFPAYHIAEKLQIPAIMASVMPNMSPTKAFALIGATKLGFGSWGNRLSYYWYYLAWWQGHADIKRWCKETLNLSVSGWFTDYGYRNGKAVPALYAYSQALMPSPDDWSKTSYASGYWFLNSHDKSPLPDDLETFIDAGKQPISIGFGSMVGMDSEHLTDIVLSAVKEAQQRAVIITGWGGLVKRATSDTVFYIDAVDYDYLFPRMKAVIHHGGAGTTATGLRFAKPTVICPFVTDQFFWGDVVYDQGYGPKPMPQRTMKADQLAKAIRIVSTDQKMQDRVNHLSQQLKNENGIKKAISFIEKQFS